MAQDVARRTYQIEEVAKLFGIGRNAAYEGAKRGDFPTIKIGKRLVAPKASIDRMLDPDEAA
jgi:predicted DNA-binding transcriptional regulator AlpA